MGKLHNIVILLLSLFNIVLGILANAIRHKMEIRGIIVKKKQLSLFADDMVVYLEDPSESTEKWLELIRWFSKGQM